MKAITYLQNMGALPQFDLWDLKMAVIVIADELFSEELMMEPDCSDWVQSVNHNSELFKQRCDLIFYASSGNVKELVSVLLPLEDGKVIQGLIEELLELRLFLHSLYKGDSWDKAGNKDEWFVRLYNDFVEMNPPERFESKANILRFYYSGFLTEVGEKILKNLNIPQ